MKDCQDNEAVRFAFEFTKIYERTLQAFWYIIINEVAIIVSTDVDCLSAPFLKFPLFSWNYTI